MSLRRKIASFIIFIALYIVGTKSYGQQDPMYSMYMFDKMLINPAYTGSADWMVGTIKHRQQFVGMKDGASTQTANFHTPIGKRFVGLGFKIVNDKIAIVNNLNAALAYSYHLNFSGGKLSLGLEAGMYSRTIDYSQLVLITLGDNALPLTATKSIAPDASWGFFYRKKRFYFGLSQNHILRSKFKDGLSVAPQSRLYAHLNIMMGTELNFSKSITMEPSFLMKAVSGAPVQFDFNSIFYYKEKIGLGIQYRTGDAVMGIFKLNITESIRMAYSYDITLSGLSTFSSGAHEIILSYGIKLPPPQTEKEVHPRYYF